MRWSLLFLLLFIPVLVFGGENCYMAAGKCKDVCAENELPEEGVFMDCAEKQECCVVRIETKKKTAPVQAVPAEKEKGVKKDGQP